MHVEENSQKFSSTRAGKFRVFNQISCPRSLNAHLAFFQRWKKFAPTRVTRRNIYVYTSGVYRACIARGVFRSAAVTMKGSRASRVNATVCAWE